jgi:hypothetical protein
MTSMPRRGDGRRRAITAGPMDFDAFIPGWRSVGRDPEGNIIEISHGFVDEEHPPERRSISGGPVARVSECDESQGEAWIEPT